MATLYWYGAIDNNWYTLGNWWQDSGHTTPATALPAGADNCVLLGPIAPVAQLDDGTFQCPTSIDSTGLTSEAIFTIASVIGKNLDYTAMWTITITGDVKLEGMAIIGSTWTVNITGDVFLEDYSAIASMSVITGNVQCRGASNTAGAISGNADFWGAAFNDYALIGGNLTYHATGTVNFGQQNAIGNYPPIGGGDESIGGDIIITAVSRPALQPI